MSDGAGDDDANPALPPASERRWRHPSELGSAAFAGATGEARTVAPPPARRARRAFGPLRRRPGLVLVAGLGSALVLGALVALTRDGGTELRSALTRQQATLDRAGAGTGLRLLVDTSSGVRALPAVSTDGRHVVAWFGSPGPAPSAALSVDADGSSRPARLIAVDRSGIVIVAVDDVVAQSPVGDAAALQVGQGLRLGSADGERSELDALDIADGQPVLRIRARRDTPAGTAVWANGRVVAVLADGADEWRTAWPLELVQGLVATAGRGTTGTPLLGISASVSETGASVVSLTTGSPAGEAGIRVGDVVRSIEGRPVSSPWHVALELRRHAPGERIRVVLGRGDSTVTVTVTLAARAT